MEASPAPILALLRTGTASRHERMERTFRIMDPGLTREGYRAWLERLYGFHAPFEAAVSAAAELLDLDWEARRKAPLIRRDLASLGVAPDAIEALPACPDLPRPEGPEALIGALYVFEGSTLGGRHIALHLARTLGLGAESGAGCFAPYGPDPMPRWRAFQARLCALATSPAAEAAILQSACGTFDRFGHWLAGGGGGGHATLGYGS